MKQKKKLCNKFLCFSILFLVISLLIGSTMGAATADSSHNDSMTQMKGPCQNIRTQQRQIFEKMTRIEGQLNAENIID